MATGVRIPPCPQIIMNNLSKTDPQVNNLIRKEISRQNNGINLIASENYVSPAVLQALGSPLTNKYSEGYPGGRYYSGNYYIDKIESLAIERVKKLFGAEAANVQPHSGSQANQAVYLALLKPKDKVLGIDLSCGGHLSHGSPVNFSGIFYHFVNYGVDQKTERLDYEHIEKIAKRTRPKLIICGTTAYSRIIDFERFSWIANKVGAYLMADIAHIAGLIAAKIHPSPVPYCDVITTTTQKTLRGPRGGVILCRKKFLPQINKAVFPGIQGGPLENNIAAKAVCFKEASKTSFKKYQQQVVKNAQAMAKKFIDEGFRLVSGGTDNHLMIINLSSLNISSKLVQEILEKANIFVNRNTIPYDPNPPFNPSGIRLGTPAITSRGFKEKESIQTAMIISRIIKNISQKSTLKWARNEVQKLVKMHSSPYDFN